MQPYEIIKASGPVEAVEKSRYKVGGLATIVEVRVSANSDGTWSVFPVVEPIATDSIQSTQSRK